MNETEDIQKASTAARIGYAVLAAGLALGIYVSQPFLESTQDWVAGDAEHIAQRLEMIVLIVALTSVPLLAVGILTVIQGSKAVSSERYPPEGMVVIVDTPIERGGSARRHGRKLQLGGVLLCVVSLGFPIAFWVIIRRLIDGV